MWWSICRLRLRRGPTWCCEWPRSQFTKAISRPIDHVVPNDYGLVLQSHNQGTPAAGLKPQGRFVQAIKEMLAEDMGASPFAQSSRKFALFGRL